MTREATRLRRTLCACALLVGTSVHAQFGAGVGVESDYRFRGVSLSNGQPDVRLSVSYDHDSGAFAGAAATGVEFMHGHRSVQLLGYAGFVARASRELSAEFGVTGSTFSGNTRYDYVEAFAGLSGERWSLRAYYSPDYFGFGQASAYVELDANAPLMARWRVFAHVGGLAALGNRGSDDRRRVRTDARVGFGVGVAESVDLQLAWVGASGGGPYVVEYGTPRNSVVLSLLASF